MSKSAAVEEKLNLGIEAARRGDRETARALLRQVVTAAPQNESAWMWLASVVDSLSERRTCLQNALKINPNNQRAREALARLDAGGTAPAPAAARPGGLRLLALGLLVVAGLALVIFLVVNALGNAASAPVNPVTAEAALNPTTTRTPDPASYTATPFYGVLVTLDSEAVSLPPTYTPTFTPTASPTPLPSATPYPLDAFAMLLIVIPPGESAPVLYAAAGDGSSPRALGSAITAAAYDPSGRKIAFVREATTTTGEGDDTLTTTGSELFVAPVDNLDDARQITTLSSAISGPAWAPDGIRIAFTSDADGDDEIYTITEDGNNLRQITLNEGVTDRDPAWSPDGESIVYVSDQDSPGSMRLYRMSALGENPALLVDMGGSSFTPRWSPDGRLITFVNDANGDADIYTMQPNGEGVYLLTAGDGSAEDRSPVFTPDSRLVAFASNRAGEVFQVYTVDLRGTTITPLMQDDSDYQALDYKPEPLLRLTQN